MVDNNNNNDGTGGKRNRSPNDDGNNGSDPKRPRIETTSTDAVGVNPIDEMDPNAAPFSGTSATALPQAPLPSIRTDITPAPGANPIISPNSLKDDSPETALARYNKVSVQFMLPKRQTNRSISTFPK
jgi:hypothetical protein